MYSLDAYGFDIPPAGDAITVGLLGGTLHHCSRNEWKDQNQPFYKYVCNYPDVYLTHDIPVTRDSMPLVNADELFLPVCDNVFKKFASIWREKGLSEAIRFAADADPEQITHVAHWIATRLKLVLDLMEREIYHRDILPTSGTGSIVDIVATRDWDTSLVRCMAWHPHCLRLAIATRDDRVRIYPHSIGGSLSRVPILRHSAQKSICCLSWRPYAGRELAVACYYGILVWTIELGAASNVLSHAILLKQRNHVPVTSIAWHPQGDVLASCSPTDLNIIIWDVSREEGVPLRRVDGGGICFIRWSPCGSRLFAASRRNVFRIWNTGTPTPWYADKWTVPNGRVVAACFSPDLTLVFAVDEDPQMRIFLLPLQDNIFDDKGRNVNDAKVAMSLIDFRKIDIWIGDEKMEVGGKIASMEWDSKGRYLAVVFQETSIIGLIKTSVDNLSRIVRGQSGYYIKGFSGEYPLCISFYEEDKYLCLTIAWNSGRIQHFPIDEKGPKVDEIVSPQYRCSRSPVFPRYE